MDFTKLSRQRTWKLVRAPASSALRGAGRGRPPTSTPTSVVVPPISTTMPSWMPDTLVWQEAGGKNIQSEERGAVASSCSEQMMLSMRKLGVLGATGKHQTCQQGCAAQAVDRPRLEGGDGCLCTGVGRRGWVIMSKHMVQTLSIVLCGGEASMHWTEVRTLGQATAGRAAGIAAGQLDCSAAGTAGSVDRNISGACGLQSTWRTSRADSRQPSLPVNHSDADSPAAARAAWHAGTTWCASGRSAAFSTAAFSRSRSPSWPTWWLWQTNSCSAGCPAVPAVEAGSVCCLRAGEAGGFPGCRPASLLLAAPLALALSEACNAASAAPASSASTVAACCSCEACTVKVWVARWGAGGIGFECALASCQGWSGLIGPWHARLVRASQAMSSSLVWRPSCKYCVSH